MRLPNTMLSPFSLPPPGRRSRIWTIDNAAWYPPGSVQVAAQNWTVDDDIVSLDASASRGLLFTYATPGLPGTATINASTSEITVPENDGVFATGDVGSGSINTQPPISMAGNTVIARPTPLRCARWSGATDALTGTPDTDQVSVGYTVRATDA